MGYDASYSLLPFSISREQTFLDILHVFEHDLCGEFSIPRLYGVEYLSVPRNGFHRPSLHLKILVPTFGEQRNNFV